MDNLRWILIFAGVAILVLLYFSGRPKRSAGQRDVLNKSRAGSAQQNTAGMQSNEGDPLLGDLTEDHYTQFDELDPEDFQRPGSSESFPEKAASANSKKATGKSSSSGLSAISAKIEAFSEKLSPKRSAWVAKSEPKDTGSDDEQRAYASKIVTIHVAALDDQLFNGAQLLDLFEQRGYHYGEMNIFHSMHHEKTVFSIAKMVEPGVFNIDDVDSFQTPGISMILQLPGPVPADVAFEVLISEAFELANGLGGTVLDVDRSTLSKQTIQHMREGIYEYMHRQKYFSGVPS